MINNIKTSLKYNPKKKAAGGKKICQPKQHEFMAIVLRPGSPVWTGWVSNNQRAGMTSAPRNTDNSSGAQPHALPTAPFSGLAMAHLVRQAVLTH